MAYIRNYEKFCDNNEKLNKFLLLRLGLLGVNGNVAVLDPTQRSRNLLRYYSKFIQDFPHHEKINLL